MTTRALTKNEGKALAQVPRASDHTSFHHLVGKASIGGAIGGLLAYLVAWPLGIDLFSSMLVVLTVAGGAMAGAATEWKKWWTTAAGAAAGVAGGALFSLLTPIWPLFGVALLGASAVPILARKETWQRQLLTGAAAAVAGAAGLMVAKAFLGADIFSGLVPGAMGALLGGAAGGLFFGLAAAPKYLRRPHDPVELKFIPALRIRDGELHKLVERGHVIYKSINKELAARVGDDSIEGLDDQVSKVTLRLLFLVDQVRSIEADLNQTPQHEIDGRLDELRKKAEASIDAAASQTYLRAAESLVEQKEALTEIRAGRERVVARLHDHVARLEKLRFSMIHRRSADAERAGDGVTELYGTLTEISMDLDATSSALGEVFGADYDLLPATSAPPAPTGETPALVDGRT